MYVINVLNYETEHIEKGHTQFFVLMCVSLCIYKDNRLSRIFAHRFYYYVTNHRHLKVQANLN